MYILNFHILLHIFFHLQGTNCSCVHSQVTYTFLSFFLRELQYYYVLFKTVKIIMDYKYFQKLSWSNVIFSPHTSSIKLHVYLKRIHLIHYNFIIQCRYFREKRLSPFATIPHTLGYGTPVVVLKAGRR